MMSDMDPSLLQDFLTESSELIEQLDQDLVQMETAEQEAQADICNSCFRALHTIKGAASFLGLTEVTTFAHAAEDALNKLRKGEVALDAQIMDSLLQAADIVRSQVEALSNGEPAPEGPQDLIDKLLAIADGQAEGESEEENQQANESGSGEAEDENLPGKPLELGSSKLDLLEYMTADLRDGMAQVIEMTTELESETTRSEGATHLQEVVEQCVRTADFFSLSELSTLITCIQKTCEKASDLLNEYAGEVTVRLKALANLVIQQADAMDSGRLLEWDISTLQSRIETVCQGEALEKGIAEAHQGCPNAVLALDGIEQSQQEAEDQVEAEQTTSDEVSTTAAVETAEKKEANSAVTATKQEEHRNGDDRRKAPERRTNNAPAIEQTIRVEVSRLESLLNMVGQLVLNKNRVMALARSIRDAEIDPELIEHFSNASGDLDRLTSELQVGVMRTRMQPLAKLFDRYPRVIRDIARMTEKKIDLEIEGKDTEVDKSVLEALADPLVHILRNSADHGIEIPEDRIAKNKEPNGTIRLSAEHQGSHVRVAIVDDGKGLDRTVIGNKAIERGLVTKDQLAQMSDEEVFRFIFAAGFSTAAVVSDLSGRGVGMDVVRTNVQKVNGEINISSDNGKGTTIEILIPLTVAIMPAMVVRIGEHLYSIPLQCVVEIVKPEDIGEHTVSGYPVIRLRDSVLPLLDMNAVLDEKPGDDSGRFAVVISIGGNRVGLRVDRLIGQQEIVIKPLDDEFTQGGPFSGATIREDGEVSLILDVAKLVREAPRHGLSKTELQSHEQALAA